MMSKPCYSRLLLIQGIYILLTAVWPIVDIGSFMQVTGYKTDQWLVKTVSVILMAIAVYFLVLAGNSGVAMPYVSLLAISLSLGLAVIDFYYSLKGIINPVYMLDGVVEIAFGILWLICSRKR